MGLEAIALGGLGLGAVGQLFGGNAQERAGQQARADALRQQSLINNTAMGMMMGGQNPFAQMLAQQHKQFGNYNPSVQWAGFDPTMLQAPEFDLNGSMGEAFNVGQDGLAQAIRSDPMTRRGTADATFEQMAANGMRFDTSELFGALGAQDARRREEALGEFRGSAGSLGQRFGTASRAQEGDLMAQLIENESARNAQIGMSAWEAAQGRRMQAAQQLGGLEGQRAQERLGLLGLAQQGGQLGLQAGMAEADLMSRFALANQNAANQAGMFNAQGAFGAQQQNISNQFARQQMLMQMLGMGNQMQMGQQGLNAQLLGIMAGVPTPGANPAAGSTWGAVGDLGQTAALLPWFFNAMPLSGI